LAAEGLRAAEHCVILDRLSAEQVSCVLGLSDVYSDSIGWSGGNTTSESLEHGLPVVTMAGKFMRERHTLAIAQQMGLDEAVVRSIDDYTALAVKLGNNRKSAQRCTLRSLSAKLTSIATSQRSGRSKISSSMLRERDPRHAPRRAGSRYRKRAWPSSRDTGRWRSTSRSRRLPRPSVY
jgi:hypothetical protein